MTFFVMLRDFAANEEGALLNEIIGLEDMVAPGDDGRRRIDAQVIGVI
jgi:hypothetical protein